MRKPTPPGLHEVFEVTRLETKRLRGLTVQLSVNGRNQYFDTSGEQPKPVTPAMAFALFVQAHCCHARQPDVTDISWNPYYFDRFLRVVQKQLPGGKRGAK